MTEGGDPIRIGIAYGGFDAETVAAFRAVSPRLVFDVTERTGRAATDEVITPQTDALIGHVLPSDLSQAPRLRWLQILSAGAESALDVGGGTWPSGIDADQRPRLLCRRHRAVHARGAPPCRREGRCA